MFASFGRAIIYPASAVAIIAAHGWFERNAEHASEYAVLIVFAAARDSSAAYLAGSILGGAGFGAAFLGGLRALTAAIPQQHRAAVMSAFHVAAYASLSLPACSPASSSHTSRCPRPSRSSEASSPRSL